jgi:hypothetical protein
MGVRHKTIADRRAKFHPESIPGKRHGLPIETSCSKPADLGIADALLFLVAAHIFLGLSHI